MSPEVRSFSNSSLATSSFLETLSEDEFNDDSMRFDNVSMTDLGSPSLSAVGNTTMDLSTASDEEYFEKLGRDAELTNAHFDEIDAIVLSKTEKPPVTCSFLAISQDAPEAPPGAPGKTKYWVVPVGKAIGIFNNG